MPIKCYARQVGSEPKPGALWWTEVAGKHILNIFLPNGGVFYIWSDSRCEIVGDLPDITLVKRDDDPNHECSISNVFQNVRYHGFLWHGALIDIDLLSRSEEEWNTLSAQDQKDVIAKTLPGYISWPLRPA